MNLKIKLAMVVFPLPLSPTREIISPEYKLNEISLTAIVSLVLISPEVYIFVRF
ncbi:MAG: hypothetical protein ACFE9S_19850 [Candidatus Hermodarchaeota archaeon]|jgi:hypothetical protein